MESTKCTSNMIVPEVLTEKNYEVWKIFMKSYLLGKGLWDIVEGSECKPEPTNPEFKAWRMKNGEALHAIMISCVEKVLFPIEVTESAKDAWDHLAYKFLQNTKGKKKLPSEAETTSMPSHAGTSSVGHAEQAAARDLFLTAEQAAARELYLAVYLENWEKTKALLQNGMQNGGGFSTSTSPSIRTVLHVAVTTGNLKFVNKVLQFLGPAAVKEVTESNTHTPLRSAAACGFTEIAEELVAADEDALHIRDRFRCIPVVVACRLSHKATTRYLYKKTTEASSGANGATRIGRENGATLLNAAIVSEMYDIAIPLLDLPLELSITADLFGSTTIKTLALRPNAFASGGGHYSTCQQWILSTSRWFDGYGVVWSALNLLVPGIKSIHNKKKDQVKALQVLETACSQMKILGEPSLHALGVYDSLFRAAEFGIVEIVSELEKMNPEILFMKDYEDRSIFSIAILFRQEKIYNFLCEKRRHMTDFITMVTRSNGNNILHDAGTLSPLSQQGKIAGAALLMQRELQWFQEVEKIAPAYFMDNINHEGLKPRDLFTKEHAELVKMGEKWMKDTANSCMIVATLIATVTFAAAFTVPGGDDQQWGYPIFLKRKLFLLFIISDALSLFSSSTSLLMFLSIYTSRYAEEDFLKSLPNRLIIGLSTLFFSIATLMVAFCATIFIMLHKHCKWAAILITILAAVPVTFFFFLQFPLFLDMIRSTYGSGLFSSKSKKTLTD